MIRNVKVEENKVQRAQKVKSVNIQYFSTSSKFKNLIISYTNET